MNYIIFDLEFNQSQYKLKHNNINKPPSPYLPLHLSQIISIGAVKYTNHHFTNNLISVSTYHSFIKPNLIPKLTNNISSLTNIKQSQINNAESFTQVISKFKNWIKFSTSKNNNSFYLISWGINDIINLRNDCILNNVSTNWLNRYIDLQLFYQITNKLKFKPGLDYTLALNNKHFEGTKHKSVEDAINTAEIFKLYAKQIDYKKKLCIKCFTCHNKNESCINNFARKNYDEIIKLNKCLN